MQHKFYQMTKQYVDVIVPHPSEGPLAEPVVMLVGDPVSLIGCEVCDMGLEEAMSLPCPGISIEDMLGANDE